MSIDSASERRAADDALRADGVLAKVSSPVLTNSVVTSWSDSWAWAILGRRRKRSDGDVVVGVTQIATVSALQSREDGSATDTLLGMDRGHRIQIGSEVFVVLDPGPVSPVGVTILFEAEIEIGGFA